MNEESSAEEVDNETSWFNDWFAKAGPIYKTSYSEFQTVTKEFDLSADVKLSNTSSFYQSLLVTKEFIRNGMESDLVASATADDGVNKLANYLEGINSKLLLVESKCVGVNGDIYFAPEDIRYLISLFLEQIRTASDFIKELFIKYIDTFNNVLKEFSKSISIGLVDEDYVGLFEDELKRVEADLVKLQRHTEKSKVHNVSFRVEPLVFVIVDKHDLIGYLKERWADKVFLTTSALDSLLGSQYLDIKKLVQVFDILSTEFYGNYKFNTGLDFALEKLKVTNSVFKPKLSISSKSNSSVFDTKYKNRSANFDRHICLGNSKMKERCFRLHFEWDEEDELIVVHHAGNHLPMGSDK
jgi:hypothetical protein